MKWLGFSSGGSTSTSSEVWSRKAEGRFPEAKELKQRVRDVLVQRLPRGWEVFGSCLGSYPKEMSHVDGENDDQLLKLGVPHLCWIFYQKCVAWAIQVWGAFPQRWNSYRTTVKGAQQRFGPFGDSCTLAKGKGGSDDQSSKLVDEVGLYWFNDFDIDDCDPWVGLENE